MDVAGESWLCHVVGNLSVNSRSLVELICLFVGGVFSRLPDSSRHACH